MTDDEAKVPLLLSAARMVDREDGDPDGVLAQLAHKSLSQVDRENWFAALREAVASGDNDRGVIAACVVLFGLPASTGEVGTCPTCLHLAPEFDWIAA